MPVLGNPAWEVSIQPLPFPITQCITLGLPLLFPETGLLPERKLRAMEEGKWRKGNGGGKKGRDGEGERKGWECMAHTWNSQPL